MHYIQIPKFIEEKRQTETKLDQWIQFIGNINEKGVKEAMEKNKVIKKAKEELEYLTGDEEIRRLAELRDKAIRDEKSNLRGAREEGETKGREEEKIEIAKEMLRQNCSVEFIVSITGISQEKIKKLIGGENSQYLTGIEEEKRLAELRDKAIRNEKSNLRGAREEGEAKGKEQRTIEIAKKMLKQNFSIKDIIAVTDLTKEEIEKIK